jgi:hypothetical protein
LYSVQYFRLELCGAPRLKSLLAAVLRADAEHGGPGGGLAPAGARPFRSTHHLWVFSAYSEREFFFSVSDPHLFDTVRFRIRIQHFRLNTGPDPDPIRIQGFDDQKCKKFTAEKYNFFISKNKIYLSLGLHKGCPSYKEAFSPQKRTSSTSKHEIF